MNDMTKRRVKLLHTPKYGIPIGEAITYPDGRHAIRIKRHNGKEIEEVPLDALVTMLVTGTSPMTQDTPSRENPH